MRIATQLCMLDAAQCKHPTREDKKEQTSKEQELITKLPVQ
jgi:hypothetical protein